jgi:cytochrome c-type biogenesis protein CcmH/NrfG
LAQEFWMMSSDHEVVQVRWTSLQAYAFAVVCLVVGFAVGYLLRGSSKAPDAFVHPEQSAAEAPQNAQQLPSADQMKHMGEKMAEPLLNELKAKPNDQELLARVASVYFRAGQYDVAANYYEKSIKLKPSAEGYISLANTYHYADADDQAIGALNKALEIDPKSANALFNLGMLEWKAKNDPNAAIDAWQRLLKANPKHPKRAQVESMIAKAKKHLTMPTAANATKTEM